MTGHDRRGATPGPAFALLLLFGCAGPSAAPDVPDFHSEEHALEAVRGNDAVHRLHAARWLQAHEPEELCADPATVGLLHEHIHRGDSASRSVLISMLRYCADAETLSEVQRAHAEAAADDHLVRGSAHDTARTLCTQLRERPELRGPALEWCCSEAPAFGSADRCQATDGPGSAPEPAGTELE